MNKILKNSGSTGPLLFVHILKSNMQGAKLRKIIWFPFGNPPLEFGFPELFQAFRKEAENLLESLALIFTGCQVGNPCEKIGFPVVILGVPDTRKLSNFASCKAIDNNN